MHPTRFARSGDVHIAYQVIGDGPLDIVFVCGGTTNVELWWDHPDPSHFLNGLASFARLIVFDKRGVGLSERVPHSGMWTLEQRMDDVRAVMDAAGSERATLFGISEGGPMCMLFAAAHPERTRALVLYGTFARFLKADDYSVGIPAKAFEAFMTRIAAEWGTGVSADYFAPSVATNEAFRRSWGRAERAYLGNLKACAPQMPEREREALARYTVERIREVLQAGMRAAPQVLFVGAAGNAGATSQDLG